MSNTANPLIDVEFIDNANYVTPENTDDVIGGVIDAPWGAVDSLVRVDSASFASVFNPFNEVSNISLASVNHVFRNQGYIMEVYRPKGANTYMGITVDFSGEDKPILTWVSSLDVTALDYADSIPLAFKYPGGFEASAQLRYNTQMSALLSVPVWNLNLTRDGVLLETLTLSFTKVSYMGQSYYYADVIRDNSKFFYFDTNAVEKVAALTEDSDVAANEKTAGVETPITGYKPFTVANATDVQKAYSKFKNIDRSLSTILIYTFPGFFKTATTATDLVIKQDIASYADICKERVALVGIPSGTYSNVDLEQEKKEKIVAAVNAMNLTSMFDSVINCEETTDYLGVRYTLDGTAGWAGRIAYVARNLRNRNALPSYRARGAYAGALTKTLDFETVAELHGELGIGSIYSGETQPYIFQIKTMFPNQTSYFNKLNFVRVVAAFLRTMFNDVADVLHTDVASNPVSLAAFETQCNYRIDNMVSRQEIDAQSHVNLTQGGINDAINNNGGEVLVIECVLYGYKLAERALIKIIATDSSVTAEISE